MSLYELEIKNDYNANYVRKNSMFEIEVLI